MQADDGSSFPPAEAGAVLIAAVVLCGGVGALVGWAVGSAGFGALGGVVVGLPTGVAAVYRRYRGYFT